MEFDDEDAEMLGFGSFWNETKEALRQGAKSTVVHARFHADARKPNTTKAAETRRRNKERRRELAAIAVREGQAKHAARADDYRHRFYARTRRDTTSTK